MAEPCIAANRGPRGAVFNPAASADTQAYIIVHTGIVEGFFSLFSFLPSSIHRSCAGPAFGEAGLTLKVTL